MSAGTDRTDVRQVKKAPVAKGGRGFAVASDARSHERLQQAASYSVEAALTLRLAVFWVATFAGTTKTIAALSKIPFQATVNREYFAPQRVLCFEGVN